MRRSSVRRFNNLHREFSIVSGLARIVAKMAGKGSEQRERVHAALRAALSTAAPEDQRQAISLVRKEFAEVPRRTWSLWVSQITDAEAVLGRKVTAAVARVNAGLARRDSADRPASSGALRRRRTNPEADNAPQELLIAPSTKTGPGGLGDGVTHRLANAPDEISSPHDLMRQLNQLRIEAEAMLDCAVRAGPSGEGHVIVDPISYAQSIALRQQIVVAQCKWRRDMLTAERLIHLLKSVFEIVQRRAPAAEAEVASALSSFAKAYRLELLEVAGVQAAGEARTASER
jgi:hypothetical protein